MKIGLFTDTYYPEVNGVANSVCLLKKELEHRGNQVYVFTVSNPAAEEKEDHVYRMKSVSFPLLKERRMCYSAFDEWFPVIKNIGLDLIHTHTEFAVGHIGRRAAQRLHIPHIHTYHTLYEDYTHYLRIPGNEKLKKVIRSLSCICCDHADEVIVPTQKVRDILLSYGVKRPILVQPTGIMLSKFDRVDPAKVMKLKEAYHFTEENHILVSVGRLSKEKNLEEIIGFMERLVRMDSMVRLMIVGDGPERGFLEEIVREKGLIRQVCFTGEVDWKEIQNYYAVGDVFTCASTSETQGLTYAEAMACGKPILVRRDDCLKELLQNGVNGYSYQNEAEFMEGYRNMFQRERYREMSQKTRESVWKMSSGAFGGNLEKIYMDLLNRFGSEGDERDGRLHQMAE